MNPVAATTSTRLPPPPGLGIGTLENLRTWWRCERFRWPGWRRLIYNASSGRSICESPAERHYRELRDRCLRHIHCCACVIGFRREERSKTTMTASVGAVFRECRPENVVAADAALFGTLAYRTDEAPPGDYSAVLNDNDVQGCADIRTPRPERDRVGCAGLQSGLDQPRPLVPTMFTEVPSRLRRTHNASSTPPTIWSIRSNT